MVLNMPLLISYDLIGKTAHKYLGISMLVLFSLHIFMNRKWYINIKKGKYNSFRTVQTVLNILLLLLIVLIASSAFIMTVVISGSSYARLIHMLSVYWCFILTSIHAGLHLRKLKIPLLITALYGLYSFIKSEIWTYMLLFNSFVYIDPDQNLLLFYLNHLTIMIFWAVVGYFISKVSKYSINNRNL